MATLLLYLLIVCIYIRPQEIPGPFYGIPVIFIVTGSTVLLLISRIVKDPSIFVKSTQNYFIVLFIASVFLSQFVHFYFYGAYKGFEDIFQNGLVYISIACLIDSIKKMKTFTWLWIIMTAYLAVSGISQYLTGVGVNEQSLIEGRIRYISIFSDPNDLAFAINLVIPFVFCELFRNGAKTKKILCIIIMAASIWSIWLTNSRSGILSFGVVCAYFIFKRFSVKVGMAGFVIIFFLIFMFGPSRMENLSVQGEGPLQESAHGRIVGMATGFWLMQADPRNIVFGAGYGSFGNYGYAAHNTIMHIAGEIGMLGLFFWLSLIYITYKNMTSISKHTEKGSYIHDIANAVTTSLIGFMAGSFFISRAYEVFLYILIGISVSVNHLFCKDFPEASYCFAVRDVKNVCALQVIIIASIFFFSRVYF